MYLMHNRPITEPGIYYLRVYKDGKLYFERYDRMTIGDVIETDVTYIVKNGYTYKLGKATEKEANLAEGLVGSMQFFNDTEEGIDK